MFFFTGDLSSFYAISLRFTLLIPCLNLSYFTIHFNRRLSSYLSINGFQNLKNSLMLQSSIEKKFRMNCI